MEEPSPSYKQRQIWERNEEWLREHADDEYDDELDEDEMDDDSCNHSQSDDIVYGIAVGAGMYMSGCLDSTNHSCDCGDCGNAGSAL